MLRLSFIVPFYNVELYIEECIRSLYNQDIPQEEYEVICIDDCSPDGSRAIVERLQQEYPTLKLLRTPKNLRQGGARNMGLDVARGKYIWFVDSDDYLKPNCISSLIECAERYNVDLLPFYFTFSNQNSAIFESQLLATYGVCTGSQYIFEAQIPIPINARCSSVCAQLISKDFITRHHLRFVEYMQYEDDDYVCQLFAFAEKVFLINQFPYIARSNSSSTTNQQASYRIILDIKCQAERLMALAPTLSAQDKRWNDMIKRLVNWSLKERVLFSLSELPTREVLLFYVHRAGWIKGVNHYVGWRAYLALHSYVFWLIYYNHKVN